MSSSLALIHFLLHLKPLMPSLRPTNVYVGAVHAFTSIISLASDNSDDYYYSYKPRALEQCIVYNTFSIAHGSSASSVLLGGGLCYVPYIIAMSIPSVYIV